MAWEVFTGGVLQYDQPAVSISALGKLHINTKAIQRIVAANYGHVELLFDNAHLLVGIRPCLKKKGAFRLSFSAGGNGAGFSCIRFLNYIGYDWSQSRSYPATWLDSGILAIEIPPIFLDHPPISRSEQLRKKAPPAPTPTGITFSQESKAQEPPEGGS